MSSWFTDLVSTSFGNACFSNLILRMWVYALFNVFLVSGISLVGMLTISLKENILKRIIYILVSLSVGGLFGDALIHLIPEAFERPGNSSRVSLFMLTGILYFFAMEKLLRWRHEHYSGQSDNKTHPIGYMTLLAFLYFSGCSAPPEFKPITMVKPSKKEELPVINQLNRFNVRSWNYIVIHHSATESGNAAEFDKSHRARGWENGLGYHFVIGNGNGSGNGEIEIGNRWMNQIDGAHAGVQEYNHLGIGICLVGNFNESYPTKAQMDSLLALIQYLQERCRIPLENVILHRHCKETDCPGGNFPYYKLLAGLEARKGR